MRRICLSGVSGLAWMAVALLTASAVSSSAQGETWYYDGYWRDGLNQHNPRAEMWITPNGSSYDVTYKCYDGGNGGNYLTSYTVNHIEGDKVFLEGGSGCGYNSSGWFTPTHFHTDYWGGGNGAGVLEGDGNNSSTPSVTIDSFSANPSTIDRGQSSTLNWTTSNDSSVSIDQGIGGVAADGSRTVTPTTTTTYTLTAQGSGGPITRQVQIIVNQPASVTIDWFNSNPSTITAGQSSTLDWGTSNASSASIDQGIGGVALDGSRAVTPNTTTTYTLTAQGSGGPVTRQVQITVNQPSGVTINSFTSNPNTIESGQSSTLTWNVADSTRVYLDNGIGDVAASGSRTVNPTTDTTYTLTAEGVGGPVAATASVFVTAPPPPAGPGTGILRQVWTGVGGATLNGLTGTGSYPNSPDMSETANAFEGPTDWADDYGQRFCGYIIAPVSGTYVFWISSDDESKLYLSNSEDPAGKTEIASVFGWTGPHQFDAMGSQQSGGITLNAGSRYYIEALHKEGAGGDNLCVRWQVPGGTIEEPIPGHRLDPFVVAPPDPDDPDSDGLTDSEEAGLGTNPNDSDSDDDGILDGAEVNIHFTNPLSADTDGDGMTDSWEIANSLNANANDASADDDVDEYTNYEEFLAGTNPRDAGSFPGSGPAAAAGSDGTGAISCAVGGSSDPSVLFTMIMLAGYVTLLAGARRRQTVVG